MLSSDFIHLSLLTQPDPSLGYRYKDDFSDVAGLNSTEEITKYLSDESLSDFTEITIPESSTDSDFTGYIYGQRITGKFPYVDGSGQCHETGGTIGLHNASQSSLIYSFHFHHLYLLHR